MSEIILDFVFNGKEIKMQCKKNEYMKDIFKRFMVKIDKNIKDIYFLYNGERINENLKLEEINSKIDELKILAVEFDISYIDDSFAHDSNSNISSNATPNKKESMILSRDIICPECGELCQISFQNYKVQVNNCKEKHVINNISLEDFYESQKINEKIILCNNCKTNKKDVSNNQFYKCCNCNINLCSICKEKHNKAHLIIDYDLKNYICYKHGERNIFFCTICNKDLCNLCEIAHEKKHKLVYHKDILSFKDNVLEELGDKINKLKKEINNIIYKFNKIINNIEKFYMLSNNLFKNFNLKNKNYQLLISMNNMKNFSKNILNDIDKILKENKFENKIKYLEETYLNLGGDNYLNPPEIWIENWVDYSWKYGIGYILNNGNTGVYFNDCSKIILNPRNNNFYYIEKFSKDKEMPANALHNISKYPKELEKKVILLQHFKKYLEGENSKSFNNILNSEEGKTINDEEEFNYVKTWYQMGKEITVFKLKKIVQIYFNDKCQIIFSLSSIKNFTYINKRGVRLTYPLQSDNSNEIKKKINLSKEIFTSILNKNKK